MSKTVAPPLSSQTDICCFRIYMQNLFIVFACNYSLPIIISLHYFDLPQLLRLYLKIQWEVQLQR